jgi:hypothetical protein
LKGVNFVIVTNTDDLINESFVIGIFNFIIAGVTFATYIFFTFLACKKFLTYTNIEDLVIDSFVTGTKHAVAAGESFVTEINSSEMDGKFLMKNKSTVGSRGNRK